MQENLFTHITKRTNNYNLPDKYNILIQWSSFFYIFTETDDQMLTESCFGKVAQNPSQTAFLPTYLNVKTNAEDLVCNLHLVTDSACYPR